LNTRNTSIVLNQDTMNGTALFQHRQV